MDWRRGREGRSDWDIGGGGREGGIIIEEGKGGREEGKGGREVKEETRGRERRSQRERGGGRRRDEWRRKGNKPIGIERI